MRPIDYLFEDIYRNYWGISFKSPPNEQNEAQTNHFGLVRRFISGIARSLLAQQGSRSDGDPVAGLQGQQRDADKIKSCATDPDQPGKRRSRGEIGGRNRERRDNGSKAGQPGNHALQPALTVRVNSCGHH